MCVFVCVCVLGCRESLRGREKPNNWHTASQLGFKDYFRTAEDVKGQRQREREREGTTW